MTALEEFQERLKERIKGDVGELLPDEVIKEMIVKVLDDEFTKPRKVLNVNRSSTYSQVYDERPSLLWEYLGPQVDKLVQRSFAKYFEENPNKLETIIEKELGKNIETFLQKCLSNFMQRQFEDFKYKFIGELQNTQPRY